MTVRRGSLQRAFEATVTASRAGGTAVDVDAALIESGRTLAKRIDEAVTEGAGQEVTRALYLMPHLVNILRELEATPASRAAKRKGSGQKGGTGLASVSKIPKPASA